MIKWFTALPKRTKNKVILGASVFLVISFFASKSAYYKYKYFKGIESEYNTLMEGMEQSKDNELEILEAGRNNTQKAKKKNVAIDTKLKEDEKTIDNSDVTDDELRDFLAKHGENDN